MKKRFRFCFIKIASCLASPHGAGRSQQEGLEQVEAANREKRRKLKATKITGDVNTERVEQLRILSIKVPGSGTGPELEGAKEVREGDWGRDTG